MTIIRPALHGKALRASAIAGLLRIRTEVDLRQNHGLELGFANLKETQAGKAYRNSGEGVNGFDSDRRLVGYSVSTEACDFTGASKESSQTGGHAEVTIGMRCPGVRAAGFLDKRVAGLLALT